MAPTRKGSVPIRIVRDPIRSRRYLAPVVAARIRQHWSLYLVRTRDGALYTGITVDVTERVAAHAAGRGAKALRGRGPLVLVFALLVGARAVALRLEARVKRLAKADKERLVAAGLPRGWLGVARRAQRALGTAACAAPECVAPRPRA